MASFRMDADAALAHLDDSNIDYESDVSDFDIADETGAILQPVGEDDDDDDDDDNAESSEDPDSDADSSTQRRVYTGGRRSGRGRTTRVRATGLRSRGRGVRAQQATGLVVSQADEDAGWMRVDGNRVDGTEVRHVDMEFSVRSPGPKNVPDNTMSPLNYFMLFITSDLLLHMVKETNQYARQFLSQRSHLGRYSRFKKWKDVTVDDIKKYLGLSINMGIVKKNNLKHYWRSKYSSNDCPYFRSVMAYNTFLLINRFFHLSDNSKYVMRGQPGFDPWYKIRPLLDSLNTNFKKYFTPNRSICIDESMVGMKNRNMYLQYMPNKRHSRFGIKKFQLCDSAPGYVMHVELYSGRDFEVGREGGQAVGVVKHLLQRCNLLEKGYHLITDNFYTKVSLAVELLQQKTLFTGTVRMNSRGFPKSLSRARLDIQTAEFMQLNGVLACAFREKQSQRKPVCLISTAVLPDLHSVRLRTDRISIKPSCVLAYNKGMGGVDMMDRKIYQVAAERTTHRYWIKIYRNLVDISLRNSFELYKARNPDSRLSCLDFISDVVEELCGDVVLNPAPGPSSTEHQIATLEGRKERDCVVCSDRSNGYRSRSRTWCPGCNVGVHKNCFAYLEHVSK